MVKFDIVDDRDLRQVMHEFWLLVEVSCVIFIALDDEVFAVRNTKARAEILHYAADKKTWFEPANFGKPGRYAGSSGFTVRPSDNQRPSAANEFLLYYLGLRTVKKLAVQDLFKFGISARDRVAYDRTI